MTRTLSRISIPLAAAAFLIAILAPAFGAAQEAQAPAPAAKRPAVKPQPREALNLSPEQEKALEEFRKARRDESRAFREEMARARDEMRGLAQDPKANEAKINALIDRSAKLRAERAKAAFKNRAEREKIFTPEQLEKMKAFRGRMMDRPGLAAGRGRAAFGPMGLRGPRPGRFMGPGFRGRPIDRWRALRHRLFLRWRRW